MALRYASFYYTLRSAIIGLLQLILDGMFWLNLYRFENKSAIKWYVNDKAKIVFKLHYLHVDKLKDLFLKQREKIKALKNAIMFLDVMIRAKWEVDSQVT
ncbi:hypothetical protein Hanom_Chr01g00050011 [Helianthus anomalus]